jgi:hypothetical protein
MRDNADESAVLPPTGPSRPGRRRGVPAALRDARMCYDHLAGVLGVSITKALIEQEALVAGDGVGAMMPGTRGRASIRSDQQWQLGQNASAIFGALGVDLADVERLRTRRPLLRACLDWTEQEPHVAGSLGAALASSLFAQGWITRQPTGRAIELTASGRRMLDRRLPAQSGIQ